MFLTKPLKGIWVSSAKQVLIFTYCLVFVQYKICTNHNYRSLGKCATEMTNSALPVCYFQLVPGSCADIWREEAGTAASSVLPLCHSSVFWVGQMSASNTALLPPWECTDTWKALTAVGGFGDEESNVTDHALFLHAAWKICRTRKEGYQLALALEFEELETQFSDILMAAMPLVMVIGTESGTSGSEV